MDVVTQFHPNKGLGTRLLTIASAFAYSQSMNLWIRTSFCGVHVIRDSPVSLHWRPSQFHLSPPCQPTHPQTCSVKQECSQWLFKSNLIHWELTTTTMISRNNPAQEWLPEMPFSTDLRSFGSSYILWTLFFLFVSLLISQFWICMAPVLCFKPVCTNGLFTLSVSGTPEQGPEKMGCMI